MSDERIVEVMAEGMHNANHCPSDGPGTWLPEAAAALAALRDAGFEVYRPENLETELFAAWFRGATGNAFYADKQLLEITTRLVPMSGETPKESEHE